MGYPIDLEMSVEELLDRWPEAIPIFIRHKMGCVGCSMAPFDTLADVTTIYHLNPQQFLGELSQAIQPALSQSRLPEGGSHRE